MCYIDAWFLATRLPTHTMINTLAIANYRSLRSIVIPLGNLNLVSDENGAGKSSLYRALRLLADTAQGGIVASLAREGGLNSTLWAGPEKIRSAMRKGKQPVQGGPRREPVHLRLGFASDEWVVSHSARLIGALESSEQCNSLHLAKNLGETQIQGQGATDAPPWQWPAR